MVAALVFIGFSPATGRPRYYEYISVLCLGPKLGRVPQRQR
jgi:hypothetical protein